jgi:DnaJ-class molecular chaperone
MMKKRKERTCGICGGTGQVSYFKGASRFLLSTEECEECAGTGFKLDAADEKAEEVTGKKPEKRKPD